MKYMHFRESCSYTALAETLSLPRLRELSEAYIRLIEAQTRLPRES